MTAIYRRELSSYFKGILGYLFTAGGRQLHQFRLQGRDERS